MLRVRPREARSVRCAVCHDSLAESIACPACAAVLHVECASDFERCPTLGCKGSFGASQWRIAGRRLAHWVETNPFYAAVLIAACATIVAVTAFVTAVAVLMQVDFFS